MNPDTPAPRGALPWPLAAGLDTAAVLLFAAAGRRSHEESLTAAGVAGTAWPFLTGTLIGWLLARGWRRPTTVPTGLIIWAPTVPVGMALRALTGQGTAAAFWVVATVSTAVLLVGWRVIARVARR
ncbi:DUF3054 domain-containing protein [Mycolicibacillus koreensis]|uniref:DUF3054 domain-containing protein n=1 Tax=Mycolicibacillus koreensis TaxID=1069220 RepID=UPI000AD1D2B2|nr:membrane protein [Mycolicibacillus koreensis]